MIGLYVDECVHGPVMCLGGMIVDGRRVQGLVRRFQEFKESVGYGSRLLPLKWSLGDNDPDETQAKRMLKRHLGNGWLGEIRSRAIEFLSRQNVLLVATVLEATQPVSADPVVFYERGIRFLLQRLYFVVNEAGSQHNYVVVDCPPREKERKAYQVYEEAYWLGFTFYNRRLRPLKENSADCLYSSSSKYSPTLQLADFWAGLVGTWAKKCLDEPSALPRYERLMGSVFPKVYGEGQRKLGYGLVFVPKGGRLKARAQTSFLRILVGPQESR